MTRGEFSGKFAPRGASQRRPGLGAFRWAPGSCRRHPRRRPGTSHRADRPERRRQDHAVQRHHRPAAADGGRVTLDGQDITDAKPHRRARLGHRPHVPAARGVRHAHRRENVLVAAEMRRGWSREKFDARRAHRRAPRARRHRVGRRRDASTRCPTGTAASSSWRARSRRKPRVLLLDEPSSGLDEDETDALARAAPRARAATASAILLVEHDMAFVMGTCEHIHVLDFGRIIAVGTPAEIQAEPAVHAAYLGDDERGRGRGRSEARRGGAGRRRIVPAPTSSEPSRQRRRRRRPRVPRSSCATCAPATARIDVLHGVDLDRCRPAGLRAARAERRRASRRPSRSRAASSRPTAGEVLSTLGERRQRRRADALARAGSVPRPRGPRHLPEPHRAREPAHGDVHAARRSTTVRGARVRAVPAAQGAAQADGRHAVGRRAADARDGPRARRPTRRCCCSTSSRWGSRRSIVEELYDVVQAHRRRRRVDPRRRAVRARGARRRRRRGDHAARPHPVRQARPRRSPTPSRTPTSAAPSPPERACPRTERSHAYAAARKLTTRQIGGRPNLPGGSEQ